MVGSLTAKQETFCLEYFKTNNGMQAAIVAGYSPKTAGVIAHENLKKPQIVSRIAELREKTGQTEANTIATVTERKEILSEIARGRLTDFMEKPTSEKLRSAAVQSIKITESTGKDGKASKRTSFSLHSPIQAIAELNKMENVYTEGGIVNIDNRKVEIIVNTEQAKSLTERLLHGELPGETEDNEDIRRE